MLELGMYCQTKEIHVQDNNADDGRRRTDVAFGFTAVRPVGAARPAAGGGGAALIATRRASGTAEFVRVRVRGIRGAGGLVAITVLAGGLADGLALGNV